MCFDMAALVGCQDECFGVEVGEFDAGVNGEGVVGHVEGDLRNKDSKFDTINFNNLTQKTRSLIELTSMTSYDWTVFLLAKSSRRRRASVQTDLKRVFEQLAPTKAFLDLLVAPATFS